jgi:hypothetical protein
MQKKEQPLNHENIPPQIKKPFTENEPEAEETFTADNDPDVIPDEETYEPPPYEEPSLGEGP